MGDKRWGRHVQGDAGAKSKKQGSLAGGHKQEQYGSESEFRVTMGRWGILMLTVPLQERSHTGRDKRRGMVPEDSTKKKKAVMAVAAGRKTDSGGGFELWKRFEQSGAVF